MTKDQIYKEYKEFVKLASEHYENFPVISYFLPSELIPHVSVFYWFARTADDIADEGEITDSERIEKLQEYENTLINVLKNGSNILEWKLLKNTIEQYNLNANYLFSLIKAFKQDCIKKNYSSTEELLEYCSFSANPVGRIMLQFFKINNDEANYYSDKVCTGLQLANFLQDISEDKIKGRIYIPLDILNKFNLDYLSVLNSANKNSVKLLISYLSEYVSTLLMEGANLLKFLKGKSYFQIKLTILGGLEIVKKVDKLSDKIILQKPKLNKTDYLRLLIKLFRKIR